MLRGSRLLVRDQNLCVDGCRICEDACAARHGHPRIRVQGTKIDTLDITDTCRQCRVGAECVEACPEDAIDWNTRGALIITDRCTGCGDCVPACPYDAVRLVNRPPVEDQSPLWTLWRRLKRWRTPAIAIEPLRPTQRADKCDLCDGYDDLACVSACPTGALRLVPVEELFPL
jgi:Fe-S-cluster-containing hydrogenase component 2